MFCGDGEYNTIGSLYLSTPEESIKKLFHDDICMCVCVCVCACACVHAYL